MSTSGTRRAWLEIDGRALRANLAAIRASLGSSVGVVPMVKADGYGLGMLKVVQALESEGPWGWGVATLAEGITLRSAGVKRPIVVFSPVTEPDYADAVEHDLSLTLSDLSALGWLMAAAKAVGRTALFHLEIDTGMGRAGVDWRRVGDWLDPLTTALGSEWVRWEGAYTHFHSADEPGGPGVVEQTERLQQALAGLRPVGDPALVHVCNSAAGFRIPERAGDVVRPGIFLYGGGIGSDLPMPEAVASLRGRVTLVRSAGPGDTLGYGSTHRATDTETWATVGIGYGDGLPRSLSNCGRALVRGTFARIIGRISMDVTVVDISGVDGVAVGDPVTFFGMDGPVSLGIDDVAESAGTISYEILTGISPRVPRVWVHD